MGSTNCSTHNKPYVLSCMKCNKCVCNDCIVKHTSDCSVPRYITLLKYVKGKSQGLFAKQSSAGTTPSAEAAGELKSSLKSVAKLMEIVQAQLNKVEDFKLAANKAKSFVAMGGSGKSSGGASLLFTKDKEALEKAIKAKDIKAATIISMKYVVETKVGKDSESASSIVGKVKSAVESFCTTGKELESSLSAAEKMKSKCESLLKSIYTKDWKCDKQYLTTKMSLSEDGLLYGNTASSGYPAIIGTVPFEEGFYAYELIPESLDCTGKEGFGIVEKSVYLNACASDKLTPTVYDTMLGFLYPAACKNMTSVRSTTMQMGQKYYVKVDMSLLKVIIFGPGLLLKANLKPGTIYYPCFSCGCKNNKQKIRPLESFAEVDDPADAWT